MIGVHLIPVAALAQRLPMVRSVSFEAALVLLVVAIVLGFLLWKARQDD